MPLTLGADDIQEYTTSEQIDWATDGEYDGWERAGAEAWLRKGYRDGDPVVIEKSCDTDKLRTRGQIIDDYGGVVVPTLVADGTVYQQYVAADADLPDRADPSTFRDVYTYDSVPDQGVEDLGVNCAVLDTLGYRHSSGGSMEEFLTDGDRCYLVDFGADLGATPDPLRAAGYDLSRLADDALLAIQRTDFMDAARDFLDDEDQPLFEAAYRDQQRAMLAANGWDDAMLDRINELSSTEQYYLQKEVR